MFWVGQSNGGTDSDEQRNVLADESKGVGGWRGPDGCRQIKSLLSLVETAQKEKAMLQDRMDVFEKQHSEERNTWKERWERRWRLRSRNEELSKRNSDLEKELSTLHAQHEKEVMELHNKYSSVYMQWVTQ